MRQPSSSDLIRWIKELMWNMENPFRYNTVIPGYDALTRNQKKKRREDYRKQMSELSLSNEQLASSKAISKNQKCPEGYYIAKTYGDGSSTCLKLQQPKVQPMHAFSIQTDSFGYFNLVPCVTQVANNTEKKKEENMYSREQEQARYLDNRLYQAWHDKERELRKQFGLTDDDPPRNGKELVQRIKDGKFTLLENDRDLDEEEDYYYGSPYSQIRWRDPATKKDRDGWQTAWNAAQKAFTETKDAVMIKSSDEGLATLQAFEKSTFN